MTRSEATTTGGNSPTSTSPTQPALAAQQQVKTQAQQQQAHQLAQQIQHQQHQLQLFQQQQFQLQQQQLQQLQAAQLQHQQTQQVLQHFPPPLQQNISSASLVAAAVQAANVAGANISGLPAATPSSSTPSTPHSFPIPQNSPEFACENVGDRIKGKRRKYCPHEVTALVLGVQRYADDSCPWSAILRDPHLGPLFHGRSGVDLKDKWRTLIKTRPELSSYTENRKNHRKYRPFTVIEERALMEGVKKYNGQRNVWSLILVDKDLGRLFNDRSNVQLKDKFRTMRRTSQSKSSGSSPTTEGGMNISPPSATTTNSTTERGANGLNPSSGGRSGANPSAQATAVASSLVSLTPQQTQALLAHNHSGLLMDPSLYMGGSFSLSPHVQLATGQPSLQQTSNRHANSTTQMHAQIQAHAQAQAIAQAQARAQAQMQQLHAQQHLRTQGQAHAQAQAQLQAQVQATGQSKHVQMLGNAYGQIPAYQFMGNQIIPQQALYYAMNSSAHQQAAHQQHQQQVAQLQHQQQLHAYQQRQAQLQQQQQAAAVAAAVMAAAQQQKSEPVSNAETSDLVHGESQAISQSITSGEKEEKISDEKSTPTNQLSAVTNTSNTVEHDNV